MVVVVCLLTRKLVGLYITSILLTYVIASNSTPLICAYAIINHTAFTTMIIIGYLTLNLTTPKKEIKIVESDYVTQPYFRPHRPSLSHQSNSNDNYA